MGEKRGKASVLAQDWSDSALAKMDRGDGGSPVQNIFLRRGGWWLARGGRQR